MDHSTVVVRLATSQLDTTVVVCCDWNIETSLFTESTELRTNYNNSAEKTLSMLGINLTCFEMNINNIF